MFKKAIREVDIFDIMKLKTGVKIKYISNDKGDMHYDFRNEESIHDWGYGEVITAEENKIKIAYYSELDTYSDSNLMRI